MMSLTNRLPRPPVSWRRLASGALCVLLGLAMASGTAAQTVVPERGVVGTGLRLRQLDGVKRVLLIGAHPDDEDTSLITALARGWGAEVGYLSLSRGEGGQNLIGSEFDEGLGIVRTGELLAARELDGGDQYFSRAFDFGYSKTAQETFRYWPREEVLADVVWVIRSFRPQVIVSIFPPNPDAGHGHHQVAGITAGEAFDVAGDPERFPEQLTGPDAVRPWTPEKLYVSARFDPEDATEGLETGGMDPLLGRSHFQLAMESRSQHRSQGMGVPEPLGPRTSPLTLVRSRVDGGEAGFFAGVDTALASFATELPSRDRRRVVEALRRYRSRIHEARGRVDPLGSDGGVAEVARALRALAEARAAVGSADGATTLRRALERRRRVAGETLLSAAGVVVEARAGDDLVVPGEELTVEVSVWNGGRTPVERAAPGLSLPEGWSAEAVTPDREGGERSFRERFFSPDREAFHTDPSPVPAGSVSRWRYRVRVPEDADVSELYYLERSRDGQMYRWPEDRSLWGEPRNPPLVEAEVALRMAPAPRTERAGSSDGGSASGAGTVVDVRVRRTAQYVGVDEVRGEYERPLLVAPALSVRSQPEVMAWPVERSEARAVTVALRSQAREGFRGRLRLEVPDGWSVEPESVPLRFQGPGEDRSVRFTVRPAGEVSAGRHALRAVAVSEGGERFERGFQAIDYPHIRRTLLFGDARTEISMFPVEVDRGRRVGYVMGSGDSGAEALRQLGMDVDLLGPDQVRQGRFGVYDVIVLGVRAYETRPDLVGSNDQLLEWVREGGTLLVQYNKYPFSGAGYAPYPVRIHDPHDRVTDETAPVTVLDPASPVFTEPNRISDADFEGWAQERGLYFLGEWDDAYTPLLEMSDPGEEPKRGSLVVAPVGEGLWIYTGLAFFRQFPEGVPGAYRLFANLVSLEPEEWTAHHGEGSE